ncbi:hypothetical protein DYI42_14085 [Vannielia litorea]|nr:hypothetical protein [Vannielia litorea]
MRGLAGLDCNAFGDCALPRPEIGPKRPWRRRTLASPIAAAYLTARGRDHRLRTSHIVQILGICRFSYPCYGGFRREHATIQDRIHFLYGEERLEERFRYFETFTLPGLRLQTDEDFKFVVLTGNQLPKAYDERLKDMLATLPQARLVQYEPLNHRVACLKAMREHIDPQGGVCGQFRLDDDDGVSYRFVERFREAFDDGHEIMKREHKFAVDFNQGYTVCIDEEGIRACAQQRQYWTPALGVYIRPHIDKTVVHFRHDTIWRQMTTLTYTGEDMFVRGLNSTNGTPFKKKDFEEMVPIEGEVARALSKTFGITEEALAKFHAAETGVS